MIKRKINITVLCLILCIYCLPSSFLVFQSQAEEEDNYRIVVSLGDSFSSGEGIEPFYGQEKNITDKVADADWIAHRSQESWPGKLTISGVDGNLADYKDENWYFVAASGAETQHMLNDFPKDYDRDSHEGTFYLEAQLDVFDEIPENETDYVTMTLGGNDAGFTDIITSCVLGSTYLNFGGLKDKLNNVWIYFFETGGIRDKLYESYLNIADRAGSQAHIIIAGYPQLISTDGSGFLISKDEASLVNQNVSAFNDAIESIVASCSSKGVDISFVSVEEAFSGHGAYSDDPYINEVIFFSQSEDLYDFMMASSYSMHPNEKGAEVYAECVQNRINEIEEEEAESAKMTSDERDIVLVLDVSSSMSGTPIEETIDASVKFIDTILEEDASIGVITYNSEAEQRADFSIKESYLTKAVSSISAGGNTNIEGGLSEAASMLTESYAKKKIIVLMSDGEPNVGKVGDDLISYADTLKDEGIIIYTLGFFENMDSEKSSAQYLMEEIASDGCHYEVADADDLIFFFGDIADQINGQKYIYIRIACPVDVVVSYNGETLDSSDESRSLRTDFGTLTFEENEEDEDDLIKVLRLKEGADYDIQITGTGMGIMDYTIGFMNEDGEYDDFRYFEDVRITKQTVIDTVATVSDTSVLNIDQDGDGKYDLRLRAESNGYGEEVKPAVWIWGASVCGVILIFAILTVVKVRKKRKGQR